MPFCQKLWERHLPTGQNEKIFITNAKVETADQIKTSKNIFVLTCFGKTKYLNTSKN